MPVAPLDKSIAADLSRALSGVWAKFRGRFASLLSDTAAKGADLLIGQLTDDGEDAPDLSPAALTKLAERQADDAIAAIDATTLKRLTAGDDAFPDDRADLIARTETAGAYHGGMLAAAEARGGMTKAWVCNEAACDVCQGLAVAGPIPAEDDWDGIDAPPGHVNCACSLTLSDAGAKAYRRKYSADQPRVPAGQSGGGEFGTVGGGSAPAATEPGAGSPPKDVEVIGSAKPGFVEFVSQEINNIPRSIRDHVEAKGGKIAIAGTSSEILGGRVDAHPRGWPPGTDWDNAGGLYDTDTKRVGIAEKVRGSNGEYVTNRRARYMVGHEYGHAVDNLYDPEGDGTDRSSRGDFRAAYKADKDGHDGSQKYTMGYFRQRGSAGREEAFAEAFGVALREKDGIGVESDRYFAAAFPKVMGIARSLLK